MNLYSVLNINFIIYIVGIMIGFLPVFNLFALAIVTPAILSVLRPILFPINLKPVSTVKFVDQKIYLISGDSRSLILYKNKLYIGYDFVVSAKERSKIEIIRQIAMTSQPALYKFLYFIVGIEMLIIFYIVVIHLIGYILTALGILSTVVILYYIVFSVAGLIATLVGNYLYGKMIIKAVLDADQFIVKCGYKEKLLSILRADINIPVGYEPEDYNYSFWRERIRYLKNAQEIKL